MDVSKELRTILTRRSKMVLTASILCMLLFVVVLAWSLPAIANSFIVIFLPLSFFLIAILAFTAYRDDKKAVEAFCEEAQKEGLLKKLDDEIGHPSAFHEKKTDVWLTDSFLISTKRGFVAMTLDEVTRLYGMMDKKGFCQIVVWDRKKKPYAVSYTNDLAVADELYKELAQRLVKAAPDAELSNYPKSEQPESAASRYYVLDVPK